MTELAAVPHHEAEACERMAHGVDIAVHVHDHGQLRYAASGALVTTTEAGTWVAPANRITWVPPFHEHGGRSYGKTSVRLVAVPPALSARLPSSPCVLVASPLLREAFLALCEERDAGPRGRLLLDLVVTEAARAPRDSLRLPHARDRRLKAVTDVLHADPSCADTLAELGRRTGTSERTLSRLFGSELSMSFHQWRTLLRIQQALLDLCEGASVTETAFDLGWSNPSSFIEAFTELVGETPGRYRARRTR